jgi:hypothetical protein
LGYKPEDRAQLVRTGYFCVDPDTAIVSQRVKRRIVSPAANGSWKMADVEVEAKTGLVLNRTLGLREDGKKD